MLYRFAAPLLFYNAPYFRRRILAVLDANPDATLVIIDGGPIAHLDSTGADILVGVAEELQARGIRLAIAGALRQVRMMLDKSGALERLGKEALPATLRTAVDAHETRAKRLDQVVPVK